MKPRGATGFGSGLAVMVLAAALVAASNLWSSTSSPPPAISQPSTTGTPSRSVGIVDALPELTRPRIERDIEAAQNAIAEEIGRPPYSAPIMQRPNFVSELEWRIFEGVAHTHADPPQELTVLVNRLRFTRLESLWRSMRSTDGTPEIRHVLAQQLLNEIPGRVRDRQFDPAQAQSLQLELLGDLVSDPIQRVQRASAESLRLTDPQDSAPFPL